MTVQELREKLDQEDSTALVIFYDEDRQTSWTIDSVQTNGPFVSLASMQPNLSKIKKEHAK